MHAYLLAISEVSEGLLRQIEAKWSGYSSYEQERPKYVLDERRPKHSVRFPNIDKKFERMTNLLMELWRDPYFKGHYRIFEMPASIHLYWTPIIIMEPKCVFAHQNLHCVTRLLDSKQ